MNVFVKKYSKIFQYLNICFTLPQTMGGNFCKTQEVTVTTVGAGKHYDCHLFCCLEGSVFIESAQWAGWMSKNFRDLESLGKTDRKKWSQN